MKYERNDTGAVCLITPAHGPSVVLSGGAEWCPNQAHDAADPVEPGLLSRQQKWLDEKAKPKAKADAKPVAAVAG
jgi:hypothetical protein